MGSLGWVQLSKRPPVSVPRKREQIVDRDPCVLEVPVLLHRVVRDDVCMCLKPLVDEVRALGVWNWRDLRRSGGGGDEMG